MGDFGVIQTGITINQVENVNIDYTLNIDGILNINSASLTIDNNGTFNVNGRSETIGSLTMTAVTGSGVLVQTGAGGVLQVNGDIILRNDRNTNDTGTTARGVLITGTGTVGSAAANTGFLDLGGQRAPSLWNPPT